MMRKIYRKFLAILACVGVVAGLPSCALPISGNENSGGSSSIEHSSSLQDGVDSSSQDSIFSETNDSSEASEPMEQSEDLDSSSNAVVDSSDFVDSLADNSSSTVRAEFATRVRVRSINGYNVSGVTVQLLKNGVDVAAAQIDTDGYATFTYELLPNADVYDVELLDLPVGYKPSKDSATKTEAVEGGTIEIILTPAGVIQESIPANKVYGLGDVMYDFSFTRADGTTTSLSAVLEEKEMVFLNFWALFCPPCKREFPFMSAAYTSVYDAAAGTKYSDKMEILAFNFTDSQTNINTYKNNNGLAFEMLNDKTSGANIIDRFDTAYIPVSIIVDRYGAIAYLHVGALSSAAEFTALFDTFLGETYTPTIL
ncbi:MAG: redoxin domain-containing protein [Clostridia bacterium]|nr:redoxin domain-containing protein [Clostridia bacterium]